MACRQCQGIETQFDDKAATRDLRSYQKKGPAKTTKMLVEALKAKGVKELTLLDIGGGIGAIQHALLDEGIGHVTGVDASTAYMQTAVGEHRRLERGDQVQYHHGDFVDLALGIDEADIVTLDRVICCYPDMEMLVSLSSDRARRYYAVVYPRVTWWTRVGFKVINIMNGLRKSAFRAFLHPPTAVDALVRSKQFEQVYYKTSFLWQVIVYARET